MNHLIANILENNPVYRNAFQTNIFFCASVEELTNDYSPESVLTIIYRLSKELDSKFREQMTPENPSPVKISLPADCEDLHA